MRICNLTHPIVPQFKTEGFKGIVRWKGISDAYRFEFNNGGPLIHRRVLFKSTIPFPVPSIQPQSNGERSSYLRLAALPCSDPDVARCLSKIFKGGTVRSLIEEPIQTEYVTVMEDRSRCYNGNDNGARRSHRYWNAFGPQGRAATMRYRLQEPGGIYAGDLMDTSELSHVYAMDLFQYGVDATDLKYPDTEELQIISKMAAAAATPQSGQSSVSGSRSSSENSKRVKVESKLAGDMEGLEIGATAALKSAEKPDDGVVKVSCVSKLYWT